ncbi:junctophilin-1 isoform X1 [Vespula squamosa]|uniref:Junctophilin-1 isoform X1 n=1 Tax=Vespula squamosa TaxID=30214 RepID=A0ABD2BWE8_VESSQ
MYERMHARTYQGQWLRGMRHGYGVRASAPFGLASHYKPPKQVRASLTSLRSADVGPAVAPTPDPTDRRDRRVDDSRGGFVLKARSDDPPARRKSLTEKSLKKGILSGLKIRKQKSTGDLEKRGTGGSIRSNASSASWMSTESSQSQASASVHTDSNASFVIEDEQMDASVVETYLGEWKNDKRTGFGISERSDGLRYEGEWFNNRKYGYGVTTFRDGTKEEGKYKNNVLITSQKKKHLFLIRSAKFRERIEAAVNAAQRASKIALQKADIAISRTATARGKAESADNAADHAREDSELAQQTARQFAPDFRQPGLERLKNREIPKYVPPPQDTVPGKSILHKSTTLDQTGSTPSKTGVSNVDSTATTTTTTTTTAAAAAATTMSSTSMTASNVMQSIRRASMKPQNMMQNQLPNQISPNQLSNQIPQMVNAQTSLPMQNPYQTQYVPTMPPNSPQQNQPYPNSVPNQYPQSPYQPNQYPNQPNAYNQTQYQPASSPQLDPGYTGYQQQQTPARSQGFQNMQPYLNQQILYPQPPVMYGPMTFAQMNQYEAQLYGVSDLTSPRSNLLGYLVTGPARRLSTEKYTPCVLPPNTKRRWKSLKEKQILFSMLKPLRSMQTDLVGSLGVLLTVEFTGPEFYSRRSRSKMIRCLFFQANQVPNQYGPSPMNQYNPQSMLTQQQQEQPSQQTQSMQQYPDGIADVQRPPSSASIRRNSRVLSPQDRPGVIGQTLNDRLDHYKRPPSRDSSVDRYARAHSRLTGSRQPSVDKTVTNTSTDLIDRSTRAPSVIRSGTPLNGSVVGSGTATPTYAASTSGQFEGALLKNRNLGQDILPSPGQPKRTESLYVTPARNSNVSGGGGGGGVAGGGASKVSLLRIIISFTYLAQIVISSQKSHGTLVRH